MATMTLKDLVGSTTDKELLDIYTELESGKIPSTSYAHEFCRKVNKMIDQGRLCTQEDGYRHIYLPSIRKVLLKEMASRYAEHLRFHKSLEDIKESHEDVCECGWCGEEFEMSELRPTDLGMLCDHCIGAIRSRGEQVTVYA